MTNSDWGDATAPPKKRGIPKWVFISCGGCLIVAILAVVVGVIVGKRTYDEVKQWGDAESQLPELQKALAFDPLPPETQFLMAIHFPMDWFVFQDTRGFVVNFTLARVSDGDDLRQTVLNPEFSGMNMGRRKDSSAAKIEVQGRELQGIRCIQALGAGLGGGRDETASVLLDVSPDAGTHAILVQITRASGEEPITDDEVRLLLKPFHVGPDR